jgi:oligopeptide/dipeptide ABC transporter ATP-binding protein
MAEPLLVVRGLKTYFRSREGIAAAVDGVGFTAPAGKTVCLVGESGCGKSVTALSVLRLIDPAAGRIVEGSVRFKGRELLTISESEMRSLRGGRIAMIFQEPAGSLNPVLSVGDQIAEAIRLHRRISRRDVRRRVLELLSETRFADPERVVRQYPHELSGGMKQRVMIAMALAGEPELLIADEPTTALDVTVQAEVLKLLRRLQQQRRLAILLITHDLGVVAEMADEVAVMYAGRIVETAPAAELFADPKHPYTRGLMRSLPRLDRDERPEPIDGVVPPATAWPAGCRFRERCPQAFGRCAEDPTLMPVESRHVACWLHATS